MMPYVFEAITKNKKLFIFNTVRKKTRLSKNMALASWNVLEKLYIILIYD